MIPCPAASYISPLPAPSSAVWAAPRRLVILGSTGSIGTSALQVVERHPGEFDVLGLAAGRNVALLAAQAQRLRPPLLAVLDQRAAAELASLLPAGYRPQVLTGAEGYAALAALPEARLVLSAQPGAAGLLPTLAAARAGKVIALANKESLVLAGSLIRAACRDSGAVILPVDSEHNAIFQALAGHRLQDVRRLILTASGGPFRGRDRDFLARVTPRQALCHPNWNMGAKISVDSATLMNKGLEVIEAGHLFGLDHTRIDVVVHPQSIVHSLVEFEDGAVLAQLSAPTMRIPLAYCLGYPKRLPLALRPLDLAGAGSLTFEPPDISLFPCLGLAVEAMRRGADYPVALSAANEAAVELFLEERIRLPEIAELIFRALDAHTATAAPDLDAILLADGLTRSRVRRWADERNR